MEANLARERLLTAMRARRTGPQDRPLTADQQAIWLGERIDPGRAGYHVTCAVRLTGALDEAALAAATADLHLRHQALRCRIAERDGRPRQHFDVLGPVWSRTDLDRGPGDARERALRRMIAADSTEPFDLATGPLWRARLVRTGPDQHVLVLVLHHLVVDGWSLGVLLHDLLGGYRGRVGGAPAPAAPAYRYADWLSERVRRERAAGTPDRLGRIVARLPTVPYDPALPGLGGPSADYRAGAVAVPGDAASRQDFSRACRRLRVTPYAALTGLFGLVLSRATGIDAMVLAAPLALRDDPRTAPLVGCMVALVPIGLRVPKDSTPVNALGVARHAIAAALADSDVPYRAVAQAAVGSSATAEDPLTTIAAEEFNVSLDPCEVAGLTVEPLPRSALRVRHSLTLSVPRGSGHPPELLYPVARWSPDAVRALADDLGDVIAAVVRYVDA